MEYLIIALLTAVSLLSIGCVYLASVVDKIQTGVKMLNDWKAGLLTFEQAIDRYDRSGGLMHVEGTTIHELAELLGVERYTEDAVPERQGWRKVKKSKKVKP